MQNSLSYNRTIKISVNSAGNVIFLIFLVTALLYLKTPSREYLFPYSPYLMLTVQVGLPLLLLPSLRLSIAKYYHDFLKVFLTLFLLFLLSLLSSLWSKFPEFVLQRSLMVYTPLILFGLVVWNDDNPLDTFIKVARGFVFLTSTLAAIAIFLYFFGSEVWTEGIYVQVFSLGPITLAQRIYGIPPLLRASSLLGNPNILAIWLMLSLLLTLYLLHIRKMRILLGYILFLLQVGGLIITFSRTGIGAAVIAVALYYYLSASSFSTKAKRVLFGFTLAGIIAGGILIFGGDLLSSDRFSINYLNKRDEIWELLLDAFKENYFLGIGFGVSSEFALQPHGVETYGHNVHLQTLVELGILGYCLMLFLWLFPLKKSFTVLRRIHNREQKLTLVVCTSLLMSLCVHQFFEGHILRYDFLTNFWIYLLYMIMHPRVKGVL